MSNNTNKTWEDYWTVNYKENTASHDSGMIVKFEIDEGQELPEIGCITFRDGERWFGTMTSDFEVYDDAQLVFDLTQEAGKVFSESKDTS